MSQLWKIPGEIPALSSRKQVVAEFAGEMGKLGPANFLYSDGDALFVHGHMRTQSDGSMRAPGLHTISVSCDYGFGRSELTSVKLESDQVQKVTLIATTPLNDGNWRPMQAGELLVLRGGEVVDSADTSAERYFPSGLKGPCRELEMVS